jgi:hypothetical protein
MLELTRSRTERRTLNMREDVLRSASRPSLTQCHGGLAKALEACNYWQLRARMGLGQGGVGDSSERICRTWTLQADWIFRGDDSTNGAPQAARAILSRVCNV